MVIIIVIGYSAIGKSSLCDNRNISFKYIDLESASFRNDEGIRPDDWYIYYCNVAEHLSKQHNIVFVSSHKEIRDRLKNSTENVICIYPSLELKDKWITKLESRYQNTKSDKDYRAWQNAIHSYDDNIKEIKECGIPGIEIDRMDYSLENIIVNYEIKLISDDMK